MSGFLGHHHFAGSCGGALIAVVKHIFKIRRLHYPNHATRVAYITALNGRVLRDGGIKPLLQKELWILALPQDAELRLV